jgi:hypothetical protein
MSFTVAVSKSIQNLPVTVPQDFLGMCYMQYPVSGTSPVGLIPWKSVRLCQQVEARWNTIETSAGVYSAAALTALDSIITFQRTNNASVYFGLYATPTFYAQTAAHPAVGDNTVNGPWGAGLGECSYPTSLTAVTNFVNMLINRYNKAGGAWYDANFATLGKGIQYWETWNEPDYPNANNAGGFWWGTAAQMVDLAQTQYAAIKALDPTIIVSTPGFNNHNLGKTFLTTTGSLGKTGLESCDVYAWHPYRMNPPLVGFNSLTEDIISGSLGINAIKEWMVSQGISLPLWISEWGFDWDSSSITASMWYAKSATFRYTWIARMFMILAAHGIKNVHPWNWNSTSATGNSGNWQQDTNGVQLAYNDFAEKVSGKTIISCTYALPGKVTLNFSDSTTWSV